MNFESRCHDSKLIVIIQQQQPCLDNKAYFISNYALQITAYSIITFSEINWKYPLYDLAAIVSLGGNVSKFYRIRLS